MIALENYNNNAQQMNFDDSIYLDPRARYTCTRQTHNKEDNFKLLIKPF
mgnify:FL=1